MKLLRALDYPRKQNELLVKNLKLEIFYSPLLTLFKFVLEEDLSSERRSILLYQLFLNDYLFACIQNPETDQE